MSTQPDFQPYVPSTESRPELTFRAVILGCIFAILFGAVTVYVGLRAGLTVAASIPIAVLSISVLRWFTAICRSKLVQSLPIPKSLKAWIATSASIL
ncbi:MAG: OPT/YSL family transporter, partial [Candidatus Sulfotelmatobacter sp.]